jgi:hypothetical protein
MLLRLSAHSSSCLDGIKRAEPQRLRPLMQNNATANAGQENHLSPVFRFNSGAGCTCAGYAAVHGVGSGAPPGAHDPNTREPLSEATGAVGTGPIGSAMAGSQSKAMVARAKITFLMCRSPTSSVRDWLLRLRVCLGQMQGAKNDACTSIARSEPLTAYDADPKQCSRKRNHEEKHDRDQDDRAGEEVCHCFSHP